MPLVPFVLIAGLFSVLSLYSFVYGTPPLTITFLVLFAVVYGWMRQVSRKDEHRLGQLMMRARLRGRNLNKNKWGAATLAPREFKRWKH